MSQAANVRLEEGWKNVLIDQFDQPYFQAIKQFLVKEKSTGKRIYPPGSLIFNAFELTPWDQVKVVILGQDPYHNPGEAMGLCFSVPRTVRRPPSLLNIYKEINRDLQIPIANHGDLTNWANQGVLLLNAMLTVEHKKAGSHRKIGWQQFTDAVIRRISEQKSGIVFLLWGNFAKAKRALIDPNKHLILESAHPSPLAGNAFQGNEHFSKTNVYLEQQGKSQIDWNVN